MKILLVEDDKIIWENIKDYLEENNFIVTLCNDWKSGLKEALKNNHDLFSKVITMDDTGPVGNDIINRFWYAYFYFCHGIN